MAEIDYKLRTAILSDRSHLANLIHFSAYLHQHLDWKPALDWIGSKPYLLIESRGEILATMACPPELADVSWIRLYAASSGINVSEAWQLLWKSARQELSKSGKIYIAAISLQNWFNELLVKSQFEQVDNVVVLRWERSPALPLPPRNNTVIRMMLPEDLEIVENIDYEAFDTIWKNSRESLELAYHQSALATLAICDDEIVGYQFSTISAMGGHLARLAIRKSMQGKGIGYRIVHDLLNQFMRQGIDRVTVNTQGKNSASLALYKKSGFKITGEAYKVYQYVIDA